MPMATIYRYTILAGLLVIFCTSCQPSKKMHQDRLYLQGIDSSNISAINIPEPAIQKGEKLAITVFSDNPEATALFNQVEITGGAAQSTSSDGTGGGAMGGYLVDIQGNILFHSLGLLRVEGLTKLQLINVLEQKLDTFLKHPYVEIRFLNKRVTLLGEVNKPGIINIPEERLNILDAIALSGDLTVYGRKDNILVIREENGKRTTGRLNIKDPAVYKSDYFYLHRNDLVYIEPIRKKPTGTDQTLLRNISLAATLVSILAILYSVFKNN